MKNGGQNGGRAGETLLSVSNLSSTARSTVIDLPGFEGWDVVDVFGGGHFPSVSDGGQLSLTFGPRDFFWLALQPPATTVIGDATAVVSTPGRPSLASHPAGTYLSAATYSLIAAWAPGHRWYPGGVEGTPEPWREVPLAADVISALMRVGDAIVQIPVQLLPAAAVSNGAGAGNVGDAVTADSAVGGVDGAVGGAEMEIPGLIGVVDGLAVLDGGLSPAVWAALLAAAGIPAPDLTGAHVLAGEQSNTSVLAPAARPGGVHPGAMMKILRTVSPGPHPDVLVPQALTAAGFAGVPPVLGAVNVALPVGSAGLPDATTALPGTPTHLAVVAQLVTDADDGFELACTYARSGQSFAALAASLGATLANFHATMREALDLGPVLDPALFVAGLRQRAKQALAVAPALTGYEAAIGHLFDRLEVALPPLPLQRIHGDLHLGQVLHSSDGWKLLDFEGEPQRPVAQRTAPDLPLRDVAGVLRSLAYAAAVGQTADESWASEAQTAFLDAYQAAAAATPGLDPSVADSILRAFTLDKALYEVVYETRQRPTWIPIPLKAVTALLSAENDGCIDGYTQPER
ncbi:MAG: phosphotransferase [Cellulomonadaceae bacterium]|nr:phosphotransferase [Cellulomonadaceae bacterium]